MVHGMENFLPDLEIKMYLRTVQVLKKTFVPTFWPPSPVKYRSDNFLSPHFELYSTNLTSSIFQMTEKAQKKIEKLLLSVNICFQRGSLQRLSLTLPSPLLDRLRTSPLSSLLNTWTTCYCHFESRTSTHYNITDFTVKRHLTVGRKCIILLES